MTIFNDDIAYSDMVALARMAKKRATIRVDSQAILSLIHTILDLRATNGVLAHELEMYSNALLESAPAETVPTGDARQSLARWQLALDLEPC